MVRAPLAFAVLHHVFMESSDSQATIGKRAMGLKVISGSGGPLSLRAAIVRASCRLVGIGWHLAILNIENRVLHDLVAKSRVVES